MGFFYPNDMIDVGQAVKVPVMVGNNLLGGQHPIIRGGMGIAYQCDVKAQCASPSAG